ncbi:MAG: cytochrome b [Gammaproteobacteria bacterium]|nr:cytochrome b [Gammaproteobacteria bacterium]MBV9697381.1 cytochrome b [Gammaproteobacteria bacterium]
MKALHYGTTAKTLHWLIVVLLTLQYCIGWFMPDIHGGMKPGAAMTWHVSIGLTILALMLARFVWRLAHPVAPESSLPGYQRISSEAVHWLLYAMVLLTTLSGWLFASARGWHIEWFFWFPQPMLTGSNRSLLNAIDGWHQIFEWSLLALIAVHVAAAFVHLFYYHDGVMRRMLPRWLRPFRSATEPGQG